MIFFGTLTAMGIRQDRNPNKQGLMLQANMLHRARLYLQSEFKAIWSKMRPCVEMMELGKQGSQ